MEAIKRKLPLHNAVVYFDFLEFLFFLEFTDSDFEENPNSINLQENLNHQKY